jgi:hypothetical protein
MNPCIQKLANSCARKHGCGRATNIVFDNVDEPVVVEHVRFGHRKHTTGEYVPNAYLKKFGWKNTYYQHARTTVALPHRYQLLPDR